ncbi:PIN-like domain superfamily protein [Stappia phage SI01]|uniref:PIN-like domain superfamily protein n=1 Tax=Stappia phage SI01 TaxID=2847766 RepID=A0AAE7SQN1_9CAUD|nr:PIN-like domain superfamily protein [Stappia phage SI01]
MKLINPTIRVPHKVDGKWAYSTFTFEGAVDKRRIKREIIRAFLRGGEQVDTRYIDECIRIGIEIYLRGLKDARNEATS